MKINQEKASIEFKRLLQIMDELREKCPWDKKQTIHTLRKLTIEETYELVDAIIDEDLQEIKKELGDILLHIVFYAKIGAEKEAFTITEVLESISEKLISRHPHIYGDVQVHSEEEVKTNWEKLKLKEGNKSILSGVPKSLPSMVKANRIQEKARGVGFDWDNKNQVWDKLFEELDELKQAVDQGDYDEIENELGDVLFSTINYARFIDIDPEAALEKTNRKFIHRFTYLEEKLKENNKQFGEVTLDEMNIWWEEAK